MQAFNVTRSEDWHRESDKELRFAQLKWQAMIQSLRALNNLWLGDELVAQDREAHRHFAALFFHVALDTPVGSEGGGAALMNGTALCPGGSGAGARCRPEAGATPARLRLAAGETPAQQLLPLAQPGPQHFPSLAPLPFTQSPSAGLPHFAQAPSSSSYP